MTRFDERAWLVQPRSCNLRQAVERNSSLGEARPVASSSCFFTLTIGLGAECLQQICDRNDLVWGAFRQQIDAPGKLYRLLESGNSLRVRIRRLPFGDQAIFVSKKRA